MKTKKILFTVLLLVGVLTGCAKEQNNSSSAEITSPKTMKSSLKDESEVVTLSSKTSPATHNLTFQQMGKIDNIFSIDEKNLLVVGDKWYLYQPLTGKVIAEAKSEYSVANCISYAEGFLLVGMKMPSTTSNGITSGEDIPYFFETYDKNLQKKSTINLDHISSAQWRGNPQIGISSDGTKLCYATINGLYLYDILGKKESQLIDLSEVTQKNAGITAIIQPCFSNNNKKIAFLAQSMDLPVVEGEHSNPTCAVIDVNGSNLVNKKPSQFSIYEQIGSYNDYALFSQDFRTPDGRLLKFTFSDCTLSDLKTTTAEESEIVHASDTGAYYTGTYLHENNWIVRIYNTQTQKQVAEKTIPCNDQSYTYQAPIIRILDAEKTCIVLMGRFQKDRKSAVSMFQF